MKKFNLIAILLYAFCKIGYTQNFIFGSNSVFINLSETYELIYLPPNDKTINNITWSCNPGSNVQLSIIDPFNKKCSVKASINNTNCNIVLKAQIDLIDVNSNITTVSITKSIRIEPYTVGSTIAYPNEINSFYLQDNCSGTPNHSACFYQFICSDPSVLSCPGNCNNTSSNSAQIIVPNPPNSPTYILNAKALCSGLAQWQAQPITINVKLRNPVITGNQSIGCSGAITNSLVYIASAVTGASTYSWNLPSGWTGSSTTNTIIVNTSGTSGGTISVQAFASNVSSIKSDIVNYVIGCCIDNLTNLPNVSSGNDNREASLTITANNIIASGVTARYHAGNSIKFINGFSSKFGSNTRAYVEGCTGNFNKAAVNDNSRLISEDSTYLTESDQSKNFFNSNSFNENSNLQVEKFSIFPNPNNGKFKIIYYHKNVMPSLISVYDLMGKILLEIKSPIEKEIEITLDDKSIKGLLLVKLNYEDEIQCRKIIVK